MAKTLIGGGRDAIARLGGNQAVNQMLTSTERRADIGRGIDSVLPARRQIRRWPLTIAQTQLADLQALKSFVNSKSDETSLFSLAMDVDAQSRATRPDAAAAGLTEAVNAIDDRLVAVFKHAEVGAKHLMMRAAAKLGARLLSRLLEEVGDAERQELRAKALEPLTNNAGGIIELPLALLPMATTGVSFERLSLAPELTENNETFRLMQDFLGLQPNQEISLGTSEDKEIATTPATYPELGLKWFLWNLKVQIEEQKVPFDSLATPHHYDEDFEPTFDRIREDHDSVWWDEAKWYSEEGNGLRTAILQPAIDLRQAVLSAEQAGREFSPILKKALQSIYLLSSQQGEGAWI